jgi:glucosamine-6-phosphate deaminase
LILPVGPVGQYPLLVKICNQERISWKNVHTFNMDEYCDWQGRPLPSDHPLSFQHYMMTQVFNQLEEELRIPLEQIHFPDPLHLDQISHQIEIAGGIDTCYGGIGYHGHIAFNEPPNTLYSKVTLDEYKQSQTRIVHLNPDTLVMNSIWNTGGNPYALPSMAVTLGFKDILASRRIRLYCSGGTWQRTVLRVALLSEPDLNYPVTLLNGHPDYAIFSDLDTALPAKTTLV